MASEHWEQENALMLPAQFLHHSSKLVAESGSGIRYRLISLWPIYRRNAPASDLERSALESLSKNTDWPVTGIVASGTNSTFKPSIQTWRSHKSASAVTTAIDSARSGTPSSTMSWAKSPLPFRWNEPLGERHLVRGKRTNNGSEGEASSLSPLARIFSLSGSLYESRELRGCGRPGW